ncbi:hypothetical protein TRVL_02347 [Trypanosoma vivax]|nr:hypothetical protein TRVL_02347 [Trypanosoma vivax]
MSVQYLRHRTDTRHKELLPIHHPCNYFPQRDGVPTRDHHTACCSACFRLECFWQSAPVDNESVVLAHALDKVLHTEQRTLTTPVRFDSFEPHCYTTPIGAHRCANEGQFPLHHWLPPPYGPFRLRTLNGRKGHISRSLPGPRR